MERPDLLLPNPSIPLTAPTTRPRGPQHIEAPPLPLGDCELSVRSKRLGTGAAPPAWAGPSPPHGKRGRKERGRHPAAECPVPRKSQCASWMLLISFLLDMAVGAMTRHLTVCHRSGVPSTYKGLPCPYASCVLASTSLLTKGNTFILSCMALLMILFMMDQSYYPHDEILESENWKKMVYLGGVIMLLLSPFRLTAFYYLIWSLSYIFFPDALWGKAVCLRLQLQRN
ncbi:transmembrane protein 269 isoform X2 [Manis pentadactyla]|uniref:transmembrane protein 269 isoform X2 n=1 Tax=Manis pentadactyla TaxID=143292 RepID=UPI00255CE894|nr:transmembrane protein 269 isoform X2 [Manis pentadactyla]